MKYIILIALALFVLGCEDNPVADSDCPPGVDMPAEVSATDAPGPVSPASEVTP